MSIIETDISTRSRVRLVSLDTPGLRSLEAAGLIALGMDHRIPRETWGEGVEPTHLMFLVSAGAVHYIGTRPHQTLQPGDMMVVPSTSPKRFATAGASARAAWFHFVEARCPVPNPLAGPRKLRCEETPLLQACLESLLRRSVHPGKRTEQTAQATSGLLLHLLKDVVQTSAEPDGAFRRRLVLLWDEVSAHLDAVWNIEALARQCGMSPGHFHRRCRASTGAGPMATVRRLRMERAAFLLDTTHASLESIAAQVGYTSPYSFSQAFTRLHGIRPGAYRRRDRGSA